jgi:hypothetical protein
MAGGRVTFIKTSFILLILAILLISVCPAASAYDPEVFRQDKVRLDIGDTVHVTRTLTIQNVIDKPTVPGYITIMLKKETPMHIGPVSIPFTKQSNPVNVTNVKAKFDDGTAISDVKVTTENGTTIIKYGVWRPISPGESVTVILEYDSGDLIERGLLFNTVNYPFTNSTIPVANAIVEVKLNSGSLTYANENPTTSGDTYVWERTNLGKNPWSVAMEYSILPLPMLPVNGSVLFWGLILLLCLLWVTWVYTRPPRRKKKDNK